MHECVSFLLCQAQRFLVGIIIDPGHQLHRGAIGLGGFDFGNGSTVRQADDGGNAVGCGSQRNPLCMIARAAGHHPMLSFLVRQLGDLVIGTPQLEGPGVLKVLGFQEHLPSRRDLRCQDQVRLTGHIPQHIPCMIDFVQCQHSVSPPLSFAAS